MGYTPHALGSNLPIVHAKWSLVFLFFFGTTSQRLKTALSLFYNNNNNNSTVFRKVEPCGEFKVLTVN